MAGTEWWRNQAADRSLSPETAAKMLMEYGRYRTLSEKLSRYTPLRDKLLKDAIRDGLLAIHPEAKAESVDRKVRMWMNGDHDMMLDRRTAIELCFVLKLGLDDADDFVAMVTETGLHWRDPDELPYIFAILRGMDYAQAAALHEETSAALAQADLTGHGEGFTMQVENRVLQLQSKEELIEYMKDSAAQLGKDRHTAWKQFMDMMAVLEEPNTSEYAPASGADSVENVLRTYLHRAAVPKGMRANQKGLDSRQRVLQSIAASWPDKEVISKMKNGAHPVTRKVLMLLFIATNGFSAEDEADDWYDEEVSDADAFEDAYERMDQMLYSCGFRCLDPRTPFDWAVIYALNVGDTFEIDQHMEQLLSNLFSQPEA